MVLNCENICCLIENAKKSKRKVSFLQCYVNHKRIANLALKIRTNLLKFVCKHFLKFAGVLSFEIISYFPQNCTFDWQKTFPIIFFRLAFTFMFNSYQMLM